MKLPYTSRPVTRCQTCGHSPLKSIFFVGYIPPVNTMPDVGSTPIEQPAYPLELLRCRKCTLVQIGLEVHPRILFPPEYPYRSASTRILRDNFAQLERESSKLLNLSGKELIVDIGSNDGTLLSNFHKAGFPVLGIEPSDAAKTANERDIRSIIRYFGLQTAREARRRFGPAGLITAANVFAHIGDIHSVVKGIVHLLDKDGVFISESHYFSGTLKTLQYDTIYHEHLRYYSLRSLSHLLKQHGLEVFHARPIPTHGGSIRVYAARPGRHKKQASVARMLAAEKKAGLDDGSAFTAFRRGVIRSKTELLGLLGNLKAKGARIAAIGAPSRASTLINYTGLDDGLISAVYEIRTSAKLNKYMPGTRIPVLDEAGLYREQPEYALLLSWHIGDELARALRRNGYKGRFIVPLPRPAILRI